MVAKTVLEFQVCKIKVTIKLKTKAIETGMILSIMDMKKILLCIFFQRSIFTEIREFATIVLWNLVTSDESEPSWLEP